MSGTELRPDLDPPPSTEPPVDAGPVERRPVVRSFLRYLRRPGAVEPHDGTPKWWAALKLLGIDFLTLVPFGLIAFLASEQIDDETFIADEGLTVVEIAIAAIVLAPLLEEVTFRLWVTSFRAGYVIVGGVLMAMFTIDELGPAQLFALPAAILLVVGIAGANRSRQERVATAWNGHFGWVFYGSAVSFGLLHLFNFDLGTAGLVDLSLAPLLIAPQLVGGLVLGYTRVRLGYWYAVANHAAFNAVVTVPLFFE